MTAATVYLSAARYVLGEHVRDHRTIEDLTARAREFGMPDRAALWGWGTVRCTDDTLEGLAARSGLATLRAAGTDAATVDGLVLCSTRFPGGPHTHGGFVERVMSGIGLEDAAFTGITLNRCANLMVGLRTAQALVTAGHHRRVLVVTTDRITDEAVRMENFALFSDGAAACLVSGEPHGPDSYEILAGASAQNPQALDWTHEISADLSRAVNDRITAASGVKTGDIDGVLHLNLYKPLVVLKERQAGFAQEQLYLDNITRIGHCFAADPLINLVDRSAAGELRTDGHYLLAASVPGNRVGVLLRKLPAPRTTENRELR